MASKRSAPSGLTLIETLVALAILSIMAVIGIRVIQGSGQRAHDVQRISVTHRHDLVIIGLLRRDFDRLVRLPAAQRSVSYSPGANSLDLPDVTWRWGGDGLRRMDHSTGVEVVLRSRPTQLTLELLRRPMSVSFTGETTRGGETLLYTITIALNDTATPNAALHVVLPATRQLL